MKPRILFIVCSTIVFLVSCNHGNEKYRIKTKYYLVTFRVVDPTLKLDTTYRNVDDSYFYLYNDKSELMKTTTADGTETTDSVSGNTVISTTVDAKGNVKSTQTNFKNDKGQVDSFVVEQNGHVTTARKFIYDAEGNKIEDKTYEIRPNENKLGLSITWKFTYKDGNLVTENTRFVNSVDTMIMINPKTLKPDTIVQRIDMPEINAYYSYMADKLNTTHGFSNSKNLLLRSVELTSPKDTASINNYRYTFDDKGRIVTEVKENDPRFKDRSATEYTYDSSAYTYY